MHYKKLKFCVIILLGMSATSLYAQETIPAAGSDITGTNGSVSYTVGQMLYSTHSANNVGSVAHGVQQPYEISVISEIPDINGSLLQCLVYPNPTADIITLKAESYESKEMYYKLFDINGKTIEFNQIIDLETTINLKELKSSTYYLGIINNQKELKTFKIIKN